MPNAGLHKLHGAESFLWS